MSPVLHLLDATLTTMLPLLPKVVAVQNCKLKLVRVVPLLIWVVPLLIWWVVPLLIWAVPLLIWWVGGLTVIIGLVSVQVTLKLELPTGTELGKKHTK